MFFDSTAYVLFLTVVTLLYWRLDFRKQNWFLLAASYFFYGWWDWRFLLLMAVSTAGDFLVAKRLDGTDSQRSRKTWLAFSITINLVFLGFFKYFNFFVESFVELAAVVGLGNVPVAVWQIVLPPAISFYTFQEIAYIVDVYRKKVEPAKSLVDYGLFVSLFPHLIAGPIQYPSHLLPQVQKPRIWNPERAFDGLILFLEGLFRKVVVADNCALIANAAFSGSLGEPNLPLVLLGTYAFAWQIYGDFSGYSSMARGSAQLLGFHFMVNFRQPYLAESLQDFWRRWHISLSTWLREYLYLPLGGNRHGNARTYRNLMLTMLLGGLWHGANWTFVVWGGIHGAGLALERFLFGRSQHSGARRLASRWTRRLVVFHLVCLSWIFFRSPSFAVAWTQLAALTVWEWSPIYWNVALFLGVFSAMLLLMDLALESTGNEYVFETRPLSYRFATAIVFCVGATLLGANQASAFIYFQF
jgi:D-alanyl-lipoteichoic acid acyltransferase DltB (MBOAT superfamily)